MPITTLDGRANETYLSFTGKELATTANRRTRETAMQAINLATVETMLSNAIRNGRGPWDAFWELALTHTVNGEEFHTLASVVKRSIVANAILAATVVPEPVTMQPRTVAERETADNLARQAAKEERAAFIASKGYNADVAERLNGEAKPGELETERRDVVQTVFPRIDVAKHVNTFSCYHGETLHVVSTYRTFRDTSPVPERTQEAETAKERKARLRAERANPFLDGGRKERKPTGKATCEPLFTFGERETDGFSRTIALRYLSKRMVYSPRSVVKGKETAPVAGKVKASKGSSSQAKIAFYRASDIEDTIQEAFILFHLACEFRTHGTLPDGFGEREAKQIVRIARNHSGNRLYDTCYACREAKNNMTRARFAERKRLDILAARMKAREDAERGAANRFYDDELEELLTLARTHGTHDARELAPLMTRTLASGERVQGVSLATVYNVLERVRVRCLKQEANDERKRLERILDTFASYGV